MCVITLRILPNIAEASIFDAINRLFKSKSKADAAALTGNIQNIPILEAESNPTGHTGGPDIVIESNALVSEMTPSGGFIGEASPEADQISIYEVREGDTLSEIAEMFGVSVNTIRWANDITTLHEGQIITILPVSGVKYTVKKGDTVESIAKIYKADASEIRSFNDLGASLAVGQSIIIPDAEAPGVKTTSSGSSGSVNIAGYFIRPIKGGVRSQGIHGHNGVDLASYAGAPVYASAGGEVIISRVSGWNGGYGNYVVIKHPNGTQTLYAHLNSVSAGAGTSVSQGDQIGTMGSTGKSTGTHLHFEVRGARNPF